jgi:soluble lytic murein transglycosylase
MVFRLSTPVMKAPYHPPLGLTLSTLVLGLTLTVAAVGVAADSGSDRALFKRAYRAANAGAYAEAERLARGLSGYSLYSYLGYASISPRLHKVPRSEVRRYLEDHAGSYLGERLRTEWLKHLGANRLWSEFLAAYRPQPEPRLRCLELQARLATGATQGVAIDALPLWMVGSSQAVECEPAFELLYRSALLNDELVWQRMRLAYASGNPGLAKHLAKRLSAATRRWAPLWHLAHTDPRRALAGVELRSPEARAREIGLHAVQRLARQDVSRALASWIAHAPQAHYSARERGLAARIIALAAAAQDHARAVALLDAVPEDSVDTAVQEARLQRAIARGAWTELVRWTEQAAIASGEQLRWEYWRARALDLTGSRAAAQRVYRKLAFERDYYGFLAADRLGVDYRMNDKPSLSDAADLAAVAARPGIARARELYALGLVPEARREWYYETTRMHPEDVVRAAVLAARDSWHDRAMLTLGRIPPIDDLELRFPTPYEPLVVQFAARRKLRPAVMYSIMKAESAFMHDARSPVGALGLMQLMPATAAETARHIGLAYRDPNSLYDPRTNITLGSAYLKRMLDRYDGNLAMAAAAYNAGPGRVRAWQPARGCVDADAWVELVPFRETRRYVRQALFNTIVYEWRLRQKVLPLAELRGHVPARDGGTCSSGDTA